MKGQLLAALGIVISAGSLIPASAGSTPATTNVISPGAVTISLSCSVDNTAQRLTLTNIRKTNIPKSFRIRWSGTNIVGGVAQQGEFGLLFDLLPHEQIIIPVDAQFHISNCKATASK